MTIEEKRLFEGLPEKTVARCHLELAQAHWVSRHTILWRVAGNPSFAYTLHYSSTGSLNIQDGRLGGGQTYPLEWIPTGPAAAILDKFPHLKGATALNLNKETVTAASELLQGQVAVSARDEYGRLVGATLLQIPGILDDLYPYTGELGVSFKGGVTMLRLWAPTARRVWLHLFPDSQTPQPTSSPAMSWDSGTGIWTARGDKDWLGMFYLYEVEVYVPKTCRVERNFVTDPYSISLSANSKRSQIVDLDSPEHCPPGWRKLKKPELEYFTDIVLYELHVRDFSVRDRSIPEEHRGTYTAFTYKNSPGMRRLQNLAKAGLTHIHLMPVFDFATVDDVKANWAQPDDTLLGGFPPGSNEQAQRVMSIRHRDGFNWGYDPYHFSTPEGSYSTDPNGSARIREFRQMIQSLNRAGLRVVMDVVYNHTYASGQSEKSVLDKIVPGYYYRLNGDGVVENSTCCANTASEHAMFEKLMIDSLLTWAMAYKVDGFRFDLMGHHMIKNMKRIRQALDGLTMEKDGVDGRKIYLYGEGWDFGEVAAGARGRNASQLNLGGNGIGVFNDRLRDAARGGQPFRGLLEQGFITGLFTDPNLSNQGSLEQQKTRLLYITDWIRLGLAGNLRRFRLFDSSGRTLPGQEIDYNGRPAAYGEAPQENILYNSAHDNETLFDAIQLKASPSASLSDRIRMHRLGLSLVLLGQGIPLLLAGDEMLRSKSLDRNSYDSGDWFNALDYTCDTNNWGIGLPPGVDEAYRPVMASLLANPELKPTKAELLQTVQFTQEMLRIRSSSRLFRLRTADEILERVRFPYSGPGAIPGVLVISLSGMPETRRADRYERIIVVFNACREDQAIRDDALKGTTWSLHPIQVDSCDERVCQSRFEPQNGVFQVPGRTTAVFVNGDDWGELV